MADEATSPYGTEIIELNVGGVLCKTRPFVAESILSGISADATTLNTLIQDPESLLFKVFGPDPTIAVPKDSKVGVSEKGHE